MINTVEVTPTCSQPRHDERRELPYLIMHTAAESESMVSSFFRFKPLYLPTVTETSCMFSKKGTSILMLSTRHSLRLPLTY